MADRDLSCHWLVQGNRKDCGWQSAKQAGMDVLGEEPIGIFVLLLHVCSVLAAHQGVSHGVLAWRYSNRFLHWSRTQRVLDSFVGWWVHRFVLWLGRFWRGGIRNDPRRNHRGLSRYCNQEEQSFRSIRRRLLTIHSSRRRFAARLNSGVRLYVLPHTMRVILLCALVLALAACGVTNGTFVSDLENCDFEGGRCSPDQASHASLEELRKLGSELVVLCESSRKDDQTYRADCRESVRGLVDKINERFGPTVRVDASEVQFEEFTICSDTFIPGRESDDCAYGAIEAIVRLHWSNRKGA